MTAVTNLQQRIWSAESRIPHLTWWGRRGSCQSETEMLLDSMCEDLTAMTHLARRFIPTVFVILCNLLR